MCTPTHLTTATWTGSSSSNHNNTVFCTTRSTSQGATYSFYACHTQTTVATNVSIRAFFAAFAAPFAHTCSSAIPTLPAVTAHNVATVNARHAHVTNLFAVFAHVTQRASTRVFRIQYARTERTNFHSALFRHATCLQTRRRNPFGIGMPHSKNPTGQCRCVGVLCNTKKACKNSPNLGKEKMLFCVEE